MPFDQQNHEPGDATLSALITARGLIAEPDSWWQNGRNDIFGRYCPITAIGERWRQRTGEDLLFDNHIIWEYLKAGAHAHDLPAFARWNDAATTTHAMVLAAFDRAIAVRLEDIRQQASNG